MKFKVGDIIKHNEPFLYGQYSMVINDKGDLKYKVLINNYNSDIGTEWSLLPSIAKDCSLVTDPDILHKLNKLIIFS